MTVQLLSEGDGTDRRPASLSWTMATLALTPSAAAGPVGLVGPAQPAGLEGIEVVVDKTNDASGDGTFNDKEEAPAPGANVAFRVRLTNPTGTPVLIEALTDTFPVPGSSPEVIAGIPRVVLDLLGGSGGRLLSNTCAALAGQVLLPNSSTLATGAPAQCTYTVGGASPPAYTGLVDAVGVRVSEVDNPGNVTGAMDTSEVRSPGGRPPFALPRVGPAVPAGGPAPEVSPEAGAPQQQAEVESEAGERLRQLARTGAAVLLLALVGCGLVAVGLSLLRSPSRGGSGRELGGRVR